MSDLKNNSGFPIGSYDPSSGNIYGPGGTGLPLGHIDSQGNIYQGINSVIPAGRIDLYTGAIYNAGGVIPINQGALGLNNAGIILGIVSPNSILK